MSLNNDYTLLILTRQRHQELMAAAAQDRLARIALSGHQPWWRRRPRGRGAGRRLVAGAPDACLPY
jgi:hypothetical protein